MNINTGNPTVQEQPPPAVKQFFNGGTTPPGGYQPYSNDPRVNQATGGWTDAYNKELNNSYNKQRLQIGSPGNVDLNDPRYKGWGITDFVNYLQNIRSHGGSNQDYSNMFNALATNWGGVDAVNRMVNDYSAGGSAWNGSGVDGLTPGDAWKTNTSAYWLDPNSASNQRVWGTAGAATPNGVGANPNGIPAGAPNVNPNVNNSAQTGTYGPNSYKSPGNFGYTPPPGTTPPGGNPAGAATPNGAHNPAYSNENVQRANNPYVKATPGFNPNITDTRGSSPRGVDPGTGLNTDTGHNSAGMGMPNTGGYRFGGGNKQGYAYRTNPAYFQR